MTMRFKTIGPDYPLILASASPRRKALLEQLRIPFRVVAGTIEENHLDGTPSENAKRLALQKARNVFTLTPDHWILGADTMVIADQTILGKPLDGQAVRAMLGQLSGREHEVVTGFALLAPDGRAIHTEHVSTLVKFKMASESEIEAYLKTGEPFGKAGGYAIQGMGVFLVESIRGSYSNVVGLPLCALTRALVSCGVLNIFPMR